jgi:glycosyltransferase involved in cell wall biosynthesis
MKILIVNDLFSLSSAAGVAVNTARELAANGLEVHYLATVQKRSEARDFTLDGVQIHLAHVPPYPVRWKAYRSLNNKPAVRVLEKALQEIRPGIVHFHNLHIHFSYAALEAGERAAIPVVLTIHDVMPFCYHKMFCFLHEGLKPDQPVDYRAVFGRCLACTRFRFNPLRNRIIRSRIARHVNRVVAVSTPMKEALEQNRISVDQVIHNGIDCAAWQPTENRGSSFRKAHQLEDCKIILYGGRLDYLKGGLHLVRAVSEFKSRIPKVKLLIPGEGGRFQKEMITLARERGMEDVLVFPGWLDGEELKGAYEAAHVVTSPSLCFESFNLINLEGMAMAKPVVASFFGGPSEVVDNGITGFLVNPLDEKDLSKKISSLLQDESLADQMGRAGRDRVLEWFDIKKTTNHTIKLYEDLVMQGH